tara:strand:- start:287 stop:703 length:417 start_codon:yes stop_codon:yes gene_type:complete
MNYWLIKTEPSTWSWEQQKSEKITMWDGVRNYQARNNLMKMKKNDLCFFYHSVKEKSIVGIVSVQKEYYPDPTDDSNKFVVVDVQYKRDLIKPISLESIKKDKRLKNLALIKQSRLSVMPIEKELWKIICSMEKPKKL